EAETRRFTSEQLLSLLREAGIPASPINTLDKVFTDPQVNALGMFPPVTPDFRIPEMRFVDLPVSLDGARASIRRMPPRLGEHTDEIMIAAGYAPEEIAELRLARVI